VFLSEDTRLLSEDTWLLSEDAGGALSEDPSEAAARVS
jgi:hypothetical protein